MVESQPIVCHFQHRRQVCPSCTAANVSAPPSAIVDERVGIGRGPGDTADHVSVSDVRWDR